MDIAMDNIFDKEEKVILEAEELLNSNSLKDPWDAEKYRDLLEEYKTLLKQITRMVKMSDLMHSELKGLSYKLGIMSNMDALTGLYNRRFFIEMFQKEWHSAVRSKVSIAIVMIDVDYFKKYNDTYGHLQGDECLKAVAEAILRAANRPRDIVVRYGGEEFVILLPESGIDSAAHVAASVLKNVELLNLPHVGSPNYGKVSVSIGIASMKPVNKDVPDMLLHMMDEALYRAKADGRNCIRE